MWEMLTNPRRCKVDAIKMSFVNKPNPNVEQYFPHQEPAIGAAYPAVSVSHPKTLERRQVADHYIAASLIGDPQ